MKSVMMAMMAFAVLIPLGAAQVTFGSASGTEPYRNIFGWHVGDVDVSWAYACVDCHCAFVGAPTLSETLPIQSCSIVNISKKPVACAATADCPAGASGEQVVLVIECCLDYVGGVFCVSHQETLVACP